MTITLCSTVATTTTTTIDHLPVELLTRIFLIASHPTPLSPFILKADQEYYTRPQSHSSIPLSHVSIRWRTVALHTPSLWNTIHFQHPSHLERARVFISRCPAPAHLDIFVDTVSHADHDPAVNLCRAEFHPTFDVITPHVTRWRTFALTVRDNECKASARARLSSCGPAPLLRTLQLYHFEDYGTAQNLYLATVRPPVVIFDGILPALRNVSLIGVNLPWAHTPFLRELKTLELALHSEGVRPTYQQWEAILRSSPDLSLLSLHYSGPRLPAITDPWPPEPDPDPIRLNALRELSLTDLDPDYLVRLLAHLALPTLDHLSLDLPEQDYTPAILALADPPPKDHTKSITTSTSKPVLRFPALTYLTVTALECTPAAWAAFLATVPRIRTLEIDFSCVPDTFCDALLATSTDGKDPLLPALETVRVAWLDGARVARLIEMLGPRTVRVKGGAEVVWRQGATRWTLRGRKGQDPELDAIMDKYAKGVDGVMVDWVEGAEEEGDEEDEGEESGEEEGAAEEIDEEEEGHDHAAEAD